jgi:ATP-dependent exoDNAse (exonuclease V) alpha subunit
MRMVDDWLACRDAGDQVLMLATERATVAQLNQHARAHLVARGDVGRRSRTYRSADDSRTIRLAVGDNVILRRNHASLPQPDGGAVAVRNGMSGRITRTDRRGITVRLGADHTSSDDQADVVLPTAYVCEHVDYGYARTVDTAQGATVDHSLFAPSASTSAERAYVALSRGRVSNRIYATSDRAWVDAISNRRGHTFATDQDPDLADLGQLPDDLAARRAALHAALTRHEGARGRRPQASRHAGRWQADPHDEEHDLNQAMSLGR